MVPHSVPRTSYLLSQESFSLGVWSQTHAAFGCICQDLAFIFLSDSLPPVIIFLFLHLHVKGTLGLLLVSCTLGSFVMV